MHDRLMTVATFNDPTEAVIARNYLQGAGISAVLLDDETVAMDWALANAVGGIKLQVAAGDVEEAHALLKRRHPEHAAAMEEERTQSATSPEQAAEMAADERLAREDEQPINQLVDRLFRTAVFGLIFWPLLLYTVFLILTLASTEGIVSQDRRWKIWVSLLLVGVVSLPIVFFSGGCLGLPVLGR